jgi:GGDEF domain-containing protein
MQNYVSKVASEINLLILWGGGMLIAAIVYYVVSRIKTTHTHPSHSLLATDLTLTLPNEDGEEAVLLLTSEYQLLGANAAFYALTGLQTNDINPTNYTERCSIENLAPIFPEQSRTSSLRSLLDLLKHGSGSVVTEFASEDVQMRWQLYGISQDGETFIHYLTVHPEHRVDELTSEDYELTELKYELQTGETKQAQLALFLLSIEGMQQLLDDTKLSTNSLLRQLKWELDMLDKASLVYYAPLEQEKVIIVLSGDNVREHVDGWAQSIIEATHYTIYNCSPVHYASVTIGVALSLPYRHNAESLLSNADYAMNMIKHRGKNGYYVYSATSL